MIINGFKSVGPVNAGEIINIDLVNIRNPYSLAPKVGFQVSTKNAIGEVLNVSDEMSLTMTKVYTQASASESSVRLSGDTAPERLGSYICTFKTTLPVPRGGSLRLTLPKEIVIENLSEVRILNANIFSNKVSIQKGNLSS